MSEGVEVNAVAAPPAQKVAGNNSELENVRRKISVIENKLAKYDLEELAVAVDVPSTRLFEILKADKDQLTELRKQQTLLLQQQQQQAAALANDDSKRRRIDEAKDVAIKKIEYWPEMREILEARQQSFFEVDQVVDVKNTTPFGQKVPRQKIYVRECYKDMFDQVCSELKKELGKVFVSGTPGVGKSLFGILCIMEIIRLLRRNALPFKVKGILYQHQKAEQAQVRCYKINLCDLTWEAMPKSFDETTFIEGKDNLLIKDGPCKSNTENCRVLWISSPRPDAFRKEIEISAAKQICTEPNTAEELIKCYEMGCAPEDAFTEEAKPIVEARKLCDESDQVNGAIIRRLAADLGPVARRVFYPRHAYKLLKQALAELNKVSMTEIINYARNGTVGDNFKFSHRLLIMEPSNNSEVEFEFSFSSVKIGLQILQNQFESERKAAATIVGSLRGTQAGIMFESYAHTVLMTSDAEFELTHLNSPNNVNRSLNVRICSGKPERTDIENSDLDNLDIADDRYYIPTDPTFAVVDSWTKNFMFQMTVADTHPIKSGAKQFCMLQKRGAPNKLVFVVPRGKAQKFNKQNLVDSKGTIYANGVQGGWNDLEQYVLEL